MISPDPFDRGRWLAAVLLVVFGVLMAIHLLAPRAQAQEGGRILIDCEKLAQALVLVAEFRDVGGDVDKVLGLLRGRLKDLPRAYWAVTEREIRRLWREALPAEDAAYSAYRRCMGQGGDMGRES